MAMTLLLACCARQRPAPAMDAGSAVFTALHRTVLTARGKDYVFLGAYSVNSGGDVRLTASSEMGGKLFDVIRPFQAGGGIVLFNATSLRDRWLTEGALRDAQRIHFANSPPAEAYYFQYDGGHRVIYLADGSESHPSSSIQFSEWKKFPGLAEEQPSVAVVSNRQFDYILTVQILAIRWTDPRVKRPGS